MIHIDTAHIDLVIFDCDGVLVDSEPLSNAVMADHISRLGWPMSGDDAIRRFKGRTMAQVHTLIEDQLGHSVDPVWREAFHKDQEARMRSDLQPVAGVKALIERVHRAGLQSCVASQGRHEKMAISLGTTGLFEIFKGRIFSAVDVPRPKPFPDLFLQAAKTMKVPPERCIVIEDSATGIEAALAAQMAVIGYDGTGTNALAAMNVALVHRLDEICVR